MAISRSELDTILDELEEELPELRKDAEDDDDFMLAFAALAEAVEDKADPDDLPYVRQRIDGMLAARGGASGR